MDYSNYQMPPVQKSNGFETAAFTLGLISIITGIVCFPYIAPVLGGLGILFAILSKGKNVQYSSKAKKGLTLSIIGMVLGIVASIFITIFSFVTLLNQYTPGELHDYFNEAYEEYYGESFDEMYQDIYGKLSDF